MRTGSAASKKEKKEEEGVCPRWTVAVAVAVAVLCIQSPNHARSNPLHVPCRVCRLYTVIRIRSSQRCEFSYSRALKPRLGTRLIHQLTHAAQALMLRHTDRAGYSPISSFLHNRAHHFSFTPSALSHAQACRRTRSRASLS